MVGSFFASFLPLERDMLAPLVNDIIEVYFEMLLSPFEPVFVAARIAKLLLNFL